MFADYNEEQDEDYIGNEHDDSRHAHADCDSGDDV